MTPWRDLLMRFKDLLEPCSLAVHENSEIMGEIQRLSLEHKQVTQALLGGKAGKTRKGS